MNAPTGFQRRLRAEIVNLIEQPSPQPAQRRRPAMTAGLSRRALFATTAVLATVVAALAALSAGAGSRPGGPATATPFEQVGFTVQAKGDGAVEIGFWSPEGAEGLQRALDQLGVPASVVVARRDCTEPRPVNDIPAGDFFAGTGSQPDTMLVRPAAMPAGAYLLIVWGPDPGPGRKLTGKALIVSSSRSTCVNSAAGPPPASPVPATPSSR